MTGTVSMAVISSLLAMGTWLPGLGAGLNVFLYRTGYGYGYSYGYFSYFIFMLPAILLAGGAQLWVKATYRKYSDRSNSRGMTGADVARLIIAQNGLSCGVEQIAGELTDHYDPQANVIRLSRGVYNGRSISAIGIAAHESGHAIQHAKNYGPIKLRMAIIPVCNIGAKAAPYLILAGFLLHMLSLVYVGIFGFCLVALFQLVTLPVEFNASGRALRILKNSGQFSEEDVSGAGKVLTAAASTYLAALFVSFMQILYYLSSARRSR